MFIERQILHGFIVNDWLSGNNYYTLISICLQSAVVWEHPSSRAFYIGCGVSITLKRSFNCHNNTIVNSIPTRHCFECSSINTWTFCKYPNVRVFTVNKHRTKLRRQAILKKRISALNRRSKRFINNYFTSFIFHYDGHTVFFGRIHNPNFRKFLVPFYMINVKQWYLVIFLNYFSASWERRRLRTGR